MVYYSSESLLIALNFFAQIDNKNLLQPEQLHFFEIVNRSNQMRFIYIIKNENLKFFSCNIIIYFFVSFCTCKQQLTVFHHFTAENGILEKKISLFFIKIVFPLFNPFFSSCFVVIA